MTKYILTFAAGILVGSGITYLYLTRDVLDDFEVEEETGDEEDEPEPEPEPEPEKTALVEEKTHYDHIVNNLYTPKPMSKDPYPISSDVYHSDNAYDKTSITYYAVCGTLANDELIFQDIDYTIVLKNLALFGTDHLEDPDVLYIRNEHQGVDYQVTWANKSYTDDYPQDVGDEDDY